MYERSIFDPDGVPLFKYYLERVAKRYQNLKKIAFM